MGLYGSEIGGALDSEITKTNVTKVRMCVCATALSWYFVALVGNVGFLENGCR